MLSTLFDRVFPLTLVFTLLVYICWYARDAKADPIFVGLLLASTAWYAQKARHHVGEERLISSLGGHAHIIRSYTPFNFGFLYRHLYFYSRNRGHEHWWEMFRSVKGDRRPYTVETVLTGRRMVFTADEENVKAILATQFGEYGKGALFLKKWEEFLGRSVFTTDGPQWHDSRQLLRPQFNKHRLNDLHIFERHIQVLLPMLSSSDNDQAIKLNELMYRFTLDAATDFLFAASVGSLENGEVEFATALDEAQRVQAIIARAGNMDRFVPRKSFRKALRTLNSFVDRYIDDALSLSAAELKAESKPVEGKTFLHAIAAYTTDRKVLRDQVLAVLWAGRETTAVTLLWLFYELSQNRGVVDKLRSEIISQVGLHRPPTYEDLKSMRYMQHTFNEVLRLYPVVPYNARIALQDTTLPRGGGPQGTDPIGITKDTPVVYSTFVMQRRSDIYPGPSSGFPDPLRFVPERWEHWTPMPWTYIPFNGGPRICIGQQFSLTEMSYTLTRILQTFGRIESRMDGHPGCKTDIVLQPATSIYVSFQD